jgi:hypothetical protein
MQKNLLSNSGEFLLKRERERERERENVQRYSPSL